MEIVYRTHGDRSTYPPVNAPLNAPVEALRAHLASLPFATADLAPVAGQLKRAPEDFEVEELPAYLPTGEGEHLYLWVEKRERTTKDAVRALCDLLGARSEEAGFAGLKDRHAITRQWISVHTKTTPEAGALEAEGVRVLQVSRHANKLRTGHLRGNRFRLKLADVAPEDDARVQKVLDRLIAQGVPNYFGVQRFGYEGKNIASAWAWLVEDRRAPREPFLRKMFASSLQSALFNAWLGVRIERGLLAQAVDGDVMRKEETGGVFVTAEPVTDQARVDSWEISPTGPMFGPSMRSPERAALELEQEVLSRWQVDPVCFERARKLAEGTRRPARARPEAVTMAREGSDLCLDFQLPRGAYATTLVAEITKSHGHVVPEDP
jgi:tRNA pseudouridine13 synthase